MGVQVTIAASQVDKQRLGYQAISLTHYADTAEPSIAEGSKIEIGGALYEFTVDEAGTGWAGIGVSTWAYILLTPSGATVAWSYTDVAPTWSTAKQGWYTGADRVVGGLYKDAGGLYTLKWLYRAGSGGVQDFREYGSGTVSFAGVAEMPGDIDLGPVVAGDTLIQSIDTERTIPAAGAYVKIKEMVAAARGVLRITFEMHTNGVNTAYGRIYINDVATGTERSTISATYVAFSEDLTVVHGDRIALYGHVVTTTGYYRYFRTKSALVVPAVLGCLLKTGLTLVDQNG